jgi:RimJ/RimL family protein N-acetyltransferase
VCPSVGRRTLFPIDTGRAKLIEMCEAERHSTWWDCAKQNVASANLARKLGYINEREYRYVGWAGKAADK